MLETRQTQSKLSAGLLLLEDVGLMRAYSILLPIIYLIQVIFVPISAEREIERVLG